MSPIRMSKFESAIRVVLAFNEAYNRHDIEGMMRLMSDESLLETSGHPPHRIEYLGKQSIAAFWRDFFDKSPTARMDIEEVFSAGERCVMRWKLTGESVEGEREYLRGVDIYRVRGESILEIRSYVKG